VTRPYALALGLTLTAMSCGGGQTRGEAFDPGWTDNDAAAAAALGTHRHESHDSCPTVATSRATISA